ncbi:MAG: hypothetical protein C7B43_09665 [Sulfobacillus benefaciens]|uniref:Uncharacterized protein n=1 Tax=Sulfobacillus benefaciens TaxID=453960 RepID=A0A2T2X2E6_9FIRM|nr:MAG: hypothetical protein C7B43_09665 [Sulfobacillus benefaciens]HBQ94689.1 hypothetical protein [Sulfobacillus sp.]
MVASFSRQDILWQIPRPIPVKKKEEEVERLLFDQRKERVLGLAIRTIPVAGILTFSGGVSC